MASGSKRPRPLDLQLGDAASIPGYSVSSSSRQRSVSSAITKPQVSNCNTHTKPIVGVGSCFLKMFLGNVAEMMFLPRGYNIEQEAVDKHWFSITAPSGEVHRVWIEDYMDSLVIRNGWPDLMEREAISQGDIGLFTRTEPNSFSLRIMTRSGLQKAPPPVSLSNSNTPARVVQWPEVKFFHAKGVKHSNKLVSTLYSLWVAARHPIILYAGHMKQSAVDNGTLVLSRDLSSKLPAGPARIGLVFDGSPLISSATIEKRQDQAAYITSGWLHFVRANDIRTGVLYVHKFEICDGGWQVTLYQI